MSGKLSYQKTHIKIKIPAIPALIVTTGIQQYTLKELEKIKTPLNIVKSKFDHLDGYKTMILLSQVDLYKGLRKIAEKNYNARHVTNAWLKFWELYYEFNITAELAFFNAELPGAALEAFNHYMRAYKQTNFNWVASSLVPGEVTGDKGEALGDTYGLFSHNREKWLMHLPTDKAKYLNNGDATIVNNIKDFSVRCGPKSPKAGVNLYTHDAGVDPSGDYNNQESTNMFVHLGCAISGFATLRRGGDFIAKQYTFFETLTWNLIILYATLFDEFYLSKPLTSRAANSEIYLVGKGFKGISEDTLELLFNILQTKSTNPIIDSKYIETLSEAIEPIVGFAQTIYSQQQTILSECLVLYNNINNIKLESLKHSQCTAWLAKYPLYKIKDNEWLPSN